MQPKTLSIILVLIFLGIIVGVFIYLKASREKPFQFIILEGLYDKDGVLIQKGATLSVVKGIQGVRYVTFKINVKNLDSIPLKMYVNDIYEPKGIDYIRPTESLTLGPGVIGMWKTDLVDITPYEGKVQDFCASVMSEKIFGLREPQKIDGCYSLRIDPDPVIQEAFKVEEDSSIGTPAINPGCTENWKCPEWTICDNSVQTRTCLDINNCGTNLNKPFESKICEATPISQEINLCLGVTCQPSILSCSDNYLSSCENICDTEIGECTICNPSCSGHENLCSGIICQSSTFTCPDGYISTCSNTCDSGTGICSTCTPSCIGHENLCSSVTCPKNEFTCPDGYVSTCINQCYILGGIATCGIDCRPSCIGHDLESPAPSDPSFETNAINGQYRTRGVWIKISGLQYNYGGYSSYNCYTIGAVIFMHTPEGYPICTRRGYEITTRVYLDDGRYGIIFKP